MLKYRIPSYNKWNLKIQPDSLSMTDIISVKDTKGSNIFWIIRKGQDAIVVDPGSSAPILKYLHKENLRVDCILITHHHSDHTAGIEDILKEHHCPVLGPENEEITSITQAFTEGDDFERIGVHFSVLSVPGHTLDHIGFIADKKHFLCGDLLFGAGCGKVFEGTMEQMHASLQKCAALPSDTLLYWGHEMTSANLLFATKVEPDNKKLLERLVETEEQLKKDGVSAPGILKNELETNPFLRVHQESVKKKAEEVSGKSLSSPAEVFAVLRSWKDRG